MFSYQGEPVERGRPKPTSATSVDSIRNTRVFQMALTALTEPRTLWRTITRVPSPRWRVLVHCISKMYFSHWKPPEVSERMWSVNLDASISREYQTLKGHSCRPSEYLGAPTTSLAVPTIILEASGSAGDKPWSAVDMSRSTSNHSHVFSLFSHLCIYVS